MRTAKISLVRNKIEDYFNKSTARVFRQSELSRILQAHIHEWELPKTQKLFKFIRFLMDNSSLREVEINFPNGNNINRYAWGNVSVFEVALSLHNRSYLSHYTAIYLNGLTKQIPKTVYLNVEQTEKPRGSGLSQQSIDRALKGNQRVSKNEAAFEDFKIRILSGKQTGDMGAITLEREQGGILRVTGIERTLIDAAVRPVYSGGVHEVLNAYKAAKGSFSVNRLAVMLKNLDYVYPYHQVVGYYLDKTGLYTENQLRPFLKQEMKFKFYLDYNMKNPSYSRKWKLFVPKGS